MQSTLPYHIPKLPDFLCVCVCGHVYFVCLHMCDLTWVPMHVGAHVIKSQRLTWGVFLDGSPPHIYLDKGSHLNPECGRSSTHASQLSEGSLGWPSTHADLSPGPHICAASTPPSDHLSAPTFLPHGGQTCTVPYAVFTYCAVLTVSSLYIRK